MKIKRLETILVKEFLFLRIYTDDGLIGLGEAGLMSKTKTVEAAIRELERYLVGKDPLQIEYHWQHMYRTPFFRGGPVLNSAISAVDIALWDIAGKHFDVPVYQLLGGKCREKVRVYVHIGGRTPEELAESAVIASKRGFTAVRFAPFIEGEFQRMRYSRLIEMAESQVKSVRKAVGYDIDICLDAHGRLSPYEAIAMARALEKYKPFFFEDPILPENIDVMADIAAHTHIPIATGERLYTIYEFAHLLSKRAVHMVRPDISIAGGISQCKKIASMAEAYYVGVVPHSPFSPVMVAASVQFYTSIHLRLQYTLVK